MDQFTSPNKESQLEHVKLELSDHNYCMQNPMELVKTDHLLEPKEEEEEPDQYENQLLEHKSEDFEYPEYLKLEPIESEHDIGPIRKQKSCWWNPHNQKCAICHKLIRPDHFICTVSKKRQMILMLGLVIAEKKSMEEAQQLITGNKLYTCTVHLKDAVTEIFNALNITSMDELNQCSNEEFQKIMEINKDICPDISFPQFRRALIGFVVKFTKSIQILTTVEETYTFSNSLEPKLEEPNDLEYTEYLKLEPIETEHDIDLIRKLSTSSKQKTRHRKCSLCRKMVCLDELIRIYSKIRQSILMLGLILKGTKSIEEAQLFISGKETHYCTVHLKDAVSEIWKALNIRSLDEFHPYGNKNMKISIEKLLNILKMMCPGFSFPQFQNDLIATVTMLTSKSSTKKAPMQKRCCMVCYQLESGEGFTDIISKNDKRILFVGLILDNRKTIREVNGLFTYPSLFCCESHLSEAGLKILEVLNIKSIDELHLCSKYKLAEVMNIVWKLCPECSAVQFKIHLFRSLRMFPLTIGN